MGNLKLNYAFSLSHLFNPFFCYQGCLVPVKVVIPPGSVLDPTETAAVVGGNVLTSQRVVDVVLKAFEVCGASQVSEVSYKASCV